MRHIHTLIEDPLQLRKKILESALHSTEALKNVDSILQVDGDMRVFRKELKMMVKTLRNSVNKLQLSLPGLPSEFTAPQLAVNKNDAQEQPPADQIVMALPDRNQIEADLEDIRKKIRMLHTY